MKKVSELQHSYDFRLSNSTIVLRVSLSSFVRSISDVQSSANYAITFVCI